MSLMILKKKKSQERGAWAKYSKLNHQWNSKNKKKKKAFDQLHLSKMDNIEGNNQNQKQTKKSFIFSVEFRNF